MSSNGIYTATITLAIMVVFLDGAALAGMVTAGLERLASPPALILGTVAGLAVLSFRPSRG